MKNREIVRSVSADFGPLLKRYQLGRMRTLYWQERAIEISQILKTHRTRWFKMMKNVSNSQADLYKEWATDIAERHTRKPDEPGYVRNPAAMFTDRVNDPAKYSQPFKK